MTYRRKNSNYLKSREYPAKLRAVGRGLSNSRHCAETVKVESYLTAEISASAVRANLALLRGRLSPGTRLCAVVKADCYGHGVETLLGVIAESADMLAVAAPQEAIELRRLGYAGDVLIFFTPCAWGVGRELRDALAELVAGDVALTVVASREVDAIAVAAGKLGRPARVHVKIDTGMTRSGVVPEGAAELVEMIRRTPGVELVGLYTHFAAADEADKSFAREQLQRLRAVIGACDCGDGTTVHAANSAAIIDLPETHLDMVRPGIAIYGYQPSRQMRNSLPLRPALRLWGPVMQIKDVPAGSRCGYGSAYTCTRASRVGLVPVGYGDGYLRCLSGKATVRVVGCDVPVLGRISMDQVIVDLTDVSGAEVGTAAEIISTDPSAPHSVENLARLAGTIPYEITCRLGRRVRRVLVE